jgi:hypothetical protein
MTHYPCQREVNVSNPYMPDCTLVLSSIPALPCPALPCVDLPCINLFWIGLGRLLLQHLFNACKPHLYSCLMLPLALFGGLCPVSKQHVFVWLGFVAVGIDRAVPTVGIARPEWFGAMRPVVIVIVIGT